MGGGFGGCTINIIREDAVSEISEKLALLYKEEMQLDLTSYVVETDEGTGIVRP
jgi:galactokinase